jgi:hypothetical protein
MSEKQLIRSKQSKKQVILPIEDFKPPEEQVTSDKSSKVWKFFGKVSPKKGTFNS